MQESILTPETSKRYSTALREAARYLREQVIVTAAEMERALEKSYLLEEDILERRIYQGYVVSEAEYARLQQEAIDLGIREKYTALHEKTYGTPLETRAKVRNRYVVLCEQMAEEITQAQRSGAPLQPQPPQLFDLLQAISNKSGFQRSGGTSANSLRELCAFYRDQKLVEARPSQPDQFIDTIQNQGALQEGKIPTQNPPSFLL